MSQSKYISFKDVGDIPLSNGKTLKELLIYDGLSYWWCCNSAFFANIWRDDLRQFGLLPKIHLYCAKYFSFLEDGVDYIANRCVRLSGYLNHESVISINESENDKIIFRASTQRWAISKSAQNVSLPYYDNIINQFPSSLIPEVIISDIPTPTVFQKFHLISNNYSCSVRASVSYYSQAIRLKLVNSRKHFKKIWDSMKTEMNWFNEVSQILEISMSELMKAMEYFLLCTCPLAARYNYLVEEIMIKERPAGVILTGEQALMGSGWVFLAKKYHIPTIAIQHGILLDDVKNNLYLQHKESDINPDLELQSYPLPDLTLVWGYADYNLLVNQGYYPENQVKVTGNPKYDIIPTYLSSRKGILQKYNIQTENKKIILWATQSHALGFDEALIYMHAVFSAVSSSQNLKLLIKPHPAEGDHIMQLYHKEQKKYPNLDVTYFTGTDNTSELISIADLVIIKNSTVGQEAVAFQKPLIVLDVSNNPDAGMFAKEGVAAGVYNPDNLSSAISKLLDDDTCISTSREEYISKYLYKVDGLSAKRCVDYLLSLINQ